MYSPNYYNLINIRDNLKARRIEANRRLTDTCNKINSLDSQCDDKKRDISYRENEITDLKNEESNLESDILELKDEIEDKKNERTDKCNELQGYVNDMQTAADNCNEIDRRIAELRGILQTPAPTPRYITDGLYCMNGIYMCKNHPPRQVLANGDEIEQYKQSMDHARSEIERLTGERSRWYDQYQNIRSKYDQCQREIQELDGEINKLQIELNNKENQLDSTRRHRIATEKAYEALINDDRYLSDQLLSTQNDASNISSEIDQLDQELQNIEMQLASSTQNSISNGPNPVYYIPQYMGNNGSQNNNNNQPDIDRQRAELERIARQELEEEARREREQARRAELERIARQELEEEERRNMSPYGDNSGQQQGQDPARSIIDDISNGWDRMKKAEQDFARQVRTVGSDIITTATDLYPNAVVGMGMKVIGAQIDEVIGERTPHTGDILIDQANKKKWEEEDRRAGR